MGLFSLVACVDDNYSVESAWRDFQKQCMLVCVLNLADIEQRSFNPENMHVVVELKARLPAESVPF